MEIHYLEIVTRDVDAVCETYAALYKTQFGDPVAELGNARTTSLHDGGKMGVRAPMHEAESPTVRPYLLVDDIEKSVQLARAGGADIAHPALEIPGHGFFAIYILGDIQHGLWQR